MVSGARDDRGRAVFSRTHAGRSRTTTTTTTTTTTMFHTRDAASGCGALRGPGGEARTKLRTSGLAQGAKGRAVVEARAMCSSVLALDSVLQRGLLFSTEEGVRACAGGSNSPRSTRQYILVLVLVLDSLNCAARSSATGTLNAMSCVSFALTLNCS